MDDIIAKEVELQYKLQKLEVSYQKLRNQHKHVDLRKISTPEEIGAVAESRRVLAMARNAELLRDLEIAASKLHTQRLCPLESKLDELKRKFVTKGVDEEGSQHRNSVDFESDPDLV